MAGASAGSYFGTPALYGVMQKVNVKNIFQNKPFRLNDLAQNFFLNLKWEIWYRFLVHIGRCFEKYWQSRISE